VATNRVVDRWQEHQVQRGSTGNDEFEETPDVDASFAPLKDFLDVLGDFDPLRGNLPLEADHQDLQSFKANQYEGGTKI
jgi:hypothetical protein